MIARENFTNIYTEGKMEKLEIVTLKKETFEQMIGSISNMAKDFGAIACNFRLKANLDAQEIGKYMTEKSIEESPEVILGGLEGVRAIFEQQKSSLHESIVESRKQMFSDAQIALDKSISGPRNVSPEKVAEILEGKLGVNEIFKSYTGKDISDAFSEKPPLGLTPREVNDELNRKQRLKEVSAAIDRYLRAEKAIPDEWFEEYHELLRFGDKF
jgi:hypothetical protein